MRNLLYIFKLGIVLTSIKTLFAYLDPGSGSLIVQLLIAIVVGILATFRLWKSRLLSLFGIKQETEDDADCDETENADVNQV